VITYNEIFYALMTRKVSGGCFPISEAVIDSRKAIPGSLFIALKGDNTDGHRYVNQAFKRGAMAAIIDKDLPDFDGKIIDTRHAKDNHIQEDFLNSPFCIRVPDSLINC